VRPKKPDDAGDENKFDTEMEAMEDGLEAWVRLPAVAEFHADVREKEAPGPRTDEGIEMKAKLRHTGDTSGQGDEGADNGEQTSNEDGDAAIALEVVFGAVKVVATEENVFAKAFDGGTAAPGTEPVGGDRAEVATDGSCGGYPEEIELAGVNEIAGEGHDDLRRQRNASRFDSHEEGDAGVSSRGDHSDNEVGDVSQNLLGHVGAVYRYANALALNIQEIYRWQTQFRLPIPFRLQQ
jgi:hypothetical protein